MAALGIVIMIIGFVILHVKMKSTKLNPSYQQKLALNNNKIKIIKKVAKL